MTTTFWSRHLPHTAYVVVLLLWAVYAAMSLTSSTSQQFQLTALQILLLRLTIILPVLIIWLLATQGAARFKQYALIIRDSPDGQALNLIANGLLWLVAYIVSLTMASAAVPHFVGSSSLETVVVIKNHLPTLMGLLGFGYLFAGSLRLKNIVRFQVWTIGTWLWFAVFAILAAYFTRYFYDHATGLVVNGRPVYALPASVLLFTLVLPYLVMWLLGLLASSNIIRYAWRVKGVIYRRALMRLVMGILAVEGFMILLQLLNLAGTIITKLALGTLLLVVYLLLLLCSAGYVFIYTGSKRLLMIEEAQ